MSVKHNTTDFVNLFGDPDRPIYGNEVIVPGSQYYYWEVQSCSGPDIGFIKTTSSVLEVGKSIYIPEYGCLEIFTTATPNETFWEWPQPRAIYSNCEQCQASNP